MIWKLIQDHFHILLILAEVGALRLQRALTSNLGSATRYQGDNDLFANRLGARPS